MTVMKLLERMEKEIDQGQTYLNIIQMMMAIEVIRDRVVGREFDKATEIRKKLHREDC